MSEIEFSLVGIIKPEDSIQSENCVVTKTLPYIVPKTSVNRTPNLPFMDDYQKEQFWKTVINDARLTRCCD